MNILHVIPSISERTGGPARAVLELSEALAAHGEQVSIFSTDHGQHINTGRARFERDGVAIELFQRKWFPRYFYAPALKERLEQCVASFDIVHIHGLWFYPTWAASRICRKNGVPYIIRPCGMLSSFSLSHHAIRKQIYGSLIEWNNVRQACAVHFTTDTERNRSSAYVTEEQAVVIPLGLVPETYLNLPSIEEYRKWYPSLQGKKVILFLGRISFKKGLELLADAFAELVESDCNVHWVIAGPDDEGFGRKLKERIRDKGIEANVTFTGFVGGDRKMALLRGSDIFCLPSYDENFSLAALEAMAAGLAVVVSDRVNLQTEIQKYHAGLVVPCEVGKLKVALGTVLADPFLRTKLGEAGKRLVEERYSWERIAKEMIQLYERLAIREPLEFALPEC